MKSRTNWRRWGRGGGAGGAISLAGLHPLNKVTDATLPRFAPTAKKVFEVQMLLGKFGLGDPESKKYKKYLRLWETTQRMMRDVNKSLPVLSKHPEFLLPWILEKKYSVGYAKQLVSLCNLWGEFVSGSELCDNQVFTGIRLPRGRFLEAVRDKYRAAVKSGDKPDRKVLPLTAEKIKSARSRLSEEHFNWIWISFFLGLRPPEVDNLKNLATQYPCEVIDRGGTLFLKIYQGKLQMVQESDRWRIIPAVMPEQRLAITMIKTGKFTRPSRTVWQKTFGPGYHAYSGRHGFALFLVREELDLSQIAAMLGHKGIETARRYYVDPVEYQMKRMEQIARRGFGTKLE